MCKKVRMFWDEIYDSYIKIAQVVYKRLVVIIVVGIVILYMHGQEEEANVSNPQGPECH